MPKSNVTAFCGVWRTIYLQQYALSFFSLSVKVTMQLIKHFLSSGSSKASSHFLYVFLALLFRVPSLELGKMDVQRSRLEIFAVRRGFRRDANIVCCKQNSLKTLSSTHALSRTVTSTQWKDSRQPLWKGDFFYFLGIILYIIFFLSRYRSSYLYHVSKSVL